MNTGKKLVSLILALVTAFVMIPCKSVAVGEKQAPPANYVSSTGIKITVTPIVFDTSEYINLNYLGEGVIEAETTNEKRVLVNLQGELLGKIPNEVWLVGEPFCNGVIPVLLKENRCALMDVTGKIITNQIFTQMFNFHNGLVAAEEDDYWGYINTKGETIVPFVYKFGDGVPTYDFSEGLAIIQYTDLDNRLCQKVIDTEGNTVIDVPINDYYIQSSGFVDGHVIVSKHDSNGRRTDEVWLMDTTGNQSLLPLNLEHDIISVTILAEDRYEVSLQDNTRGIVDGKGNIIFPFIYDGHWQMQENSGLIFTVDSHFVDGRGTGYTGMIDLNGQLVIPEDFTTNKGWSLSHFVDGISISMWVDPVTGESSYYILSTDEADVSVPTVLGDYIYNADDPGEEVALPVDELEHVTNTSTATSAVNTLTSGMTTAQKTSATGTDLATLFAETAVSKAASKEVTGSEVIINAAAVKELEATAASAAQVVETALVNGGVSTGRYIANTVTLTTEQTGKITIKVDPDILTTKVDKIRVETPKYALTLKVSDLEADLTNIVTISAESMDVGTSCSYALGGTGKAAAMNTMVVLDLPGGHTTNPVTLSFPSGSGKGEGEAVVNESGAASTSKYNPATVTMDGKINTSGKYTVKSNEKDFTDIASKSAEMQNAIRYLALKGIINGTSETTFSPDGSISRAEIAALIVRALGKLDSTATANFKDVTTADWYYTAAASSQKNGIINGYTDNTFKGKNPIVKQEIVAVAARVLKNEMNYKEPANTQTYLAKYSDTVAGWAQPEVALATRENLIVYRVDGTFSGAKNMTRGDAAIIIYRLFQHIW